MVGPKFILQPDNRPLNSQPNLLQRSPFRFYLYSDPWNFSVNVTKKINIPQYIFHVRTYLNEGHWLKWMAHTCGGRESSSTCAIFSAGTLCSHFVHHTPCYHLVTLHCASTNETSSHEILRGTFWRKWRPVTVAFIPLNLKVATVSQGPSFRRHTVPSLLPNRNSVT